jgi:hypothetical protein
MTSRRHRPPGDVPRPVVRYGLWRSVAAAPAMIGSLLLLVLTCAASGRWSGLLRLTWTACTAAVTTRVGERMTVRARTGSIGPAPDRQQRSSRHGRQPSE